MKTWWLSFADATGNRGVAIVDAYSFMEAVRASTHLGINPGGEVLGGDIPPEHLGQFAEWRGRLIPPDVARAMANARNVLVSVAVDEASNVVEIEEES